MKENNKGFCKCDADSEGDLMETCCGSCCCSDISDEINVVDLDEYEIIIIDDVDHTARSETIVGDNEKYSCEEVIDGLRKKCYSAEQLYILTCIWGRQYDDATPKVKPDISFINQYLNAKLEETETQGFLTLNDKNLTNKVSVLLKDFADALQKLKDCGMCKLFYYTKVCMKNCITKMLTAWTETSLCPFITSGFSSRALIEIKEDVKLLHQTKCCCSNCFTLISGYEKFVCEVALHEEIHIARKD